ncbi:MAG: CoA-binding protein [Oceanidesulfovibrio sp.]
MIDFNAIKTILAESRTIAIIGAKDKPSQPVDRVGRYLIEAGYTVIPVHPKRQNVWGLTTYPTITEIEEPVDIVDLFRASQHCPDHAREVLALKHLPRLFWMQSGIASPEAEAILADSPTRVVSDECLMVVHRRLLP